MKGGANTMKLRTIKEMKCLQCTHKWLPRKYEVHMCPKCHSVCFDSTVDKSKYGKRYPKNI